MGEKILSVKTAKLRLIFNKNYVPEVHCCSFIELCVLLADLGQFSWVLVPPVSSLYILYPRLGTPSKQSSRSAEEKRP